MKLNVVYSTDENYAIHAVVSIASLFQKNREFKEIVVYIIDNNLSDFTKNKLESLVKEDGRSIKFISILDICADLNKKDDFPVSAYARLFLDRIPDIDKILYLDCDTVVNNSLKELWDTDLTNYYVAGVQDTAAQYLVKSIGMTANDRYLNSGVLLINLDLWRKDNLTKKFLNFIDYYCGVVPHHDQGIINGVCKEKILILHPKYNMMPEMLYFNTKQIKKLYHLKNYYTDKELTNIKENAVIIHYISKFYNRPWYKDCSHPLKGLYTKLLFNEYGDRKLDTGSMNRGVLIRKKVFEVCPFSVYNTLEQFLYYKRLLSIKYLYRINRRNK